MLPGPIVLADPLPDGWRRPDPAPWRDPAEVAVTVERLAPVAEPIVTRTPGVMGGAACIAGTRIDVVSLLELCWDGWHATHIQRDAYPHIPLDTIRAAIEWGENNPDEIARDMRDVDRAPVIERDVKPDNATRAERIEAAARALVVATRAPGPTYAWAAVWEEIAAARASLVAALCSCTAHGPDLACVEHGEALRAWQKRNAP